MWRGKGSDDGCVESKKKTKRANKAHLGVWRGKASDEVCGKQIEHQTSLRGSSGCVER